MNTTTIKKIGYIALYYFIAIALRYYILIVKPSFFENADYFVKILLEGIGPLFGGLLLIKVFKRPNELRVFSIGIWKSLILILIPIVLFALVGILNVGQPYYIGAAKLVFGAILYGAFEEYGWRGYLQSELKNLNKHLKYFIIAVLWYIWHLEFGFDMQHLSFFAILLFGTYGMGVVADKTKSLVIVALFHSFFNLFYLAENLPKITTIQIVAIMTISVLSILFVMRGLSKKAIDN